MKKIIIIILSFICMLCLTGCCNSSFSLSTGKDVIDAKLLDAIIKENANDSGNNYETLNKTPVCLDELNFDDKIILDISDDFVVYHNDDNNLNFYSLIIQDVIVEIEFSSLNEYFINECDYSHSYLYLNTETSTYIFDMYGNMLYSGDDQISNVNYIMKDNNLYVQVSYYDENNAYQTISYKYNNDSSVSYVIIDQNSSNENVGDKLGNFVDLKIIGLEGYFLEAYGRYSFYNYDYKFLSSVEFDGQYDIVAIFGDEIIFQCRYEVPTDSDVYDCYFKNVKYNISTFGFNYKTGKKTTKDYNVIFENTKLLINNDDYKYYSTTVSQINSDKSISDSKTYLVDGKGKFHDDITAIDFSTFKKIGDNYLSRNAIIYDEHLNIISYINNYSLKADSTNTYIICGSYKYGIANSEGIAITDFNYDFISTDVVNNCVFAEMNNKFYRLCLNNNITGIELLGDCVYLGNNIIVRNYQDLFFYETVDESYIYSETSINNKKFPSGRLVDNIFEGELFIVSTDYLLDNGKTSRTIKIFGYR